MDENSNSNYQAISDSKGNKIIGSLPNIVNSSIDFKGENNILFCENGVKLNNSRLSFGGNNSLIYLSSNYMDYKVEIVVYQDFVVHIGRNNYFNNKLQIVLSEHEHLFIGDTCLFATNIVIRNADPHLIYSCETGRRLNTSKSIYIGDHVWVGQSVTILKDTKIDSGSIIGANSTVSGKKIPNNTIWAGNPCRQVKENVFWDRRCVHGFTEEMTGKSNVYEEFLKQYKDCQADSWIFQYEEEEVVEWSLLENAFSSGKAEEKYQFLKDLNSKNRKNRFVHPERKNKKNRFLHLL